MKRADGIVGLDPRFNIGDVVFNGNGLAYEIEEDPVRPTLSGYPGRSTAGALFRSLDGDNIKCRYTLSTQRNMLTASQASAMNAARSRAAVTSFEDEYVAIF